MSSAETVTHIDYALLAKAHPRRHLVHKFWARKPHNVVAEYIEHYSKNGEIVLDPFVGSGVTAIEALRLGRKAVALDLNPIATFITRMIAKPGPRSHWSRHSATSFWAVHRYWIPPRFLESNVWMLFESAAIKGAQGVLRGKKDANKQIPFYKEATAFSDLEDDANILIGTQSALDLSSIPDNSIDYVFTDPPYGGDIQYFELSTLWLSWLSGEEKDGTFNLDWWEREITINPQQSKDFDYYHNRLHVAFREIFRVLKSGRFLTVTFHNTDVKVYNSILRAVIFAGFELQKIIYQPPARASAKALLQPYGSAVGDYYIRFHKPEKSFEKVFEREADEKRAKKIILESIKKILIERGEPTPLTDILKGHTLIYSELRKLGYRFFGANPESISTVLDENKDKEFTFIKGEGWWFKEPSKYRPGMPLNERVELTVLDTLHRKVATFDDILQDIYLNFTNAQTPSPNSVKDVVEEYATPKAGKWILKPKVRDREREHSEMIGFLAELGSRSGHEIWIGLREQSDTHRGKPLSELCDFDQLSLREVSPDDVDKYVKQIDILWIKDGQVAFSFEVEYTTAVTEAFLRCSAIPESHQTKRFIVVPKEREKFLYRKLSSQLLRERVEKEGWKIIFFRTLREFYNWNVRKKSIDPSLILEIARTPVEERVKQATIESFSE